MLWERCPAEFGVQEHTGGVDHRRVCGGCAGLEKLQNLVFEGFACGIDRRGRDLAGGDSPAKAFDGGATCFHHRSVAVFADRRAK